MDLQTRKILFIQEFLRTANSSMLEKFEKMLRQERKRMYEQEAKTITLEQYDKRIDSALDDYENKRLTHAEKLKKEISTWK